VLDVDKSICNVCLKKLHRLWLLSWRSRWLSADMSMRLNWYMSRMRLGALRVALASLIPLGRSWSLLWMWVLLLIWFRVLLRLQMLLRLSQLLLLSKSLDVFKLLNRSWWEISKWPIRHVIKSLALAFELCVKSSPCVVLQIALVLMSNILARSLMVTVDRVSMIRLYVMAVPCVELAFVNCRKTGRVLSCTVHQNICMAKGLSMRVM
jgi:hypothetical protein